MAEILHDIRVTLTIDTNKATYTEEFNIEDYGDTMDMIDDFLESINTRIGTDYRLP